MIHRILFSLIMSLQLSFLMTAWVTWINLGWSPEFYQQWIHAFILAWPAAALISLFSAPEIHKLTTVMSNKVQSKAELKGQ
ncbi:hypothetical protein CXF85_21845 [Colwellia sp. 75C3]|uniref:DUF2798 domain-containing protein n=1 Tax=Colwellia sp. 75C3 TaxID=888425 RepID=UPI000C33C22D|nr:DUF2798 domain-containing protein [Colwellia sp. 75C3]PKG80758.1 hypothetical protein CXF85_21845 [Colwellia sp. 75C3]